MLFQNGKDSQYMKPIYCDNSVNTMAKRALFNIEMVMVSVVFAWKCFSHYLLQWAFVFLTSYTFFPWLINGVNMSKVVQKWVIEL